ncbi:YcxB family protein [Niabella insulamsoli]|uniref:YcxB family protein n=1 Tax=Niabella insulamsoli TaxID=3144874 RepID=UPI0031FDBEFB
MNFCFSNKIKRKDFYSYCVRNSVKDITLTIPALLGLLLVVDGMPSFISKTDGVLSVGNSRVFIGFCLVLMSILRVYQSCKDFVVYFAEETLSCDEEGLTKISQYSTGRYKWKAFLMIKESDKFLLLYVNKKQALYVQKDLLLPEQIQFIKSKIPAL